MSATAELPRPTSVVEQGRSLLDDIVSRMSAIEAKQARPSPVQLRTWEEIERFAEKAAKSGMVPKDYANKPDAICIAVQMGSELGLMPMQALQNIAVINGRPSVWGDAMLALCRASPLCSDIEERTEGEGDTLTAICVAKRVGKKPVIQTFSVADAKRANLWKTTPKITKQGREGSYEVDSGPWYSYPARMLQMRARGFALRDAFPDVLKGLISREEAQDIQADDEAASPLETIRRAAPPPAETSKVKPPPAETRREQINREVPMDQGSRTWGPSKFLAWFEEAARACGDYAEFVQLMKDEADDLDRMRKGPMTDHRAKLEGIISEANGRFGKLAAKPPADDAGWPGPDPEQMRREREAAAVA